MKYRKTVLVDAEPYKLGMEDGFIWHGDYGPEPINHKDYNEEDFQGYKKGKPFIWTLEGYHEITPTDMILTGIKGERWPVKKDIFDLTYEAVEE